MPRHWFTSDLHIGHVNIIRYCDRPFTYQWYPHDPDVDAMNEALVDAWNSVVAPEDTVWVLGDLALGKIKDSLAVAAMLQGRKFLVPGNHDRVWGSKLERGRAAYAEAGFTVLPEVVYLHLLESTALSEKVCMSHLPYDGDSHAEDRFDAHRPPRGPHWLLHGHVHTQWLQRGRMINVGVDAWGGRPASTEEIGALIEAGPNDLPCPSWRDLVYP